MAGIHYKLTLNNFAHDIKNPAKVEIRPKNSLTFSFNPFFTLA